MDLGWSGPPQRYAETVLRFAAEQLADDVVERDAGQTFWREGWRRCAEFGIQGLALPERYGGGEADRPTVVAALDALGYACRDNGLIFALNAQMWGCQVPILAHGTETQRDQWLPGLADGSLIGGLAMTEPDSGSDAFALSTTAEEHNGGYLLRGHKTYITNAPVADVLVVIARTGPPGSAFGLTAFLVARDTPGLTIGAPVAKMGLRTAPMSDVTLTDCWVPADARLGRAGAGMAVFTAAMDWERACILAAAVGTMRRLLDRSVGHARQRRRFGRPIGDFQAVSHRIVEMKLRLETSRLLLRQLAERPVGSRRPAGEAALTKLHISESLVQTAMDALHLHGALGYLTATELEREVRDALAARLYSGTSEIQRNIVARDLGL